MKKKGIERISLRGCRLPEDFQIDNYRNILSVLLENYRAINKEVQSCTKRNRKKDT